LREKTQKKKRYHCRRRNNQKRGGIDVSSWKKVGGGGKGKRGSWEKKSIEGQKDGKGEKLYLVIMNQRGDW